MQTIIELDEAAEDQKLMDGLLRREPRALDALHKKYHAILRSIIMQTLHDDAEADDVLQEVFLQVWDRAANFSANKGRLVNWLCTLARRRAIDRLRQHSAYRRATDRYEISCLHTNKSAEETRTVEREACRDDLRELLQQHMRTLPSHQEQVIRMAFFENRSQREISEMTNTPLGTVKTRIELGIRKLAHAFGGQRKKIA